MKNIYFIIVFLVISSPAFLLIYEQYKYQLQIKKCSKCVYYNMSLYFSPCVDCIFENEDYFKKRE